MFYLTMKNENKPVSTPTCLLAVVACPHVGWCNPFGNGLLFLSRDPSWLPLASPRLASFRTELTLLSVPLLRWLWLGLVSLTLGLWSPHPAPASSAPGPGSLRVWTPNHMKEGTLKSHQPKG